jgi:hypothetical protein
MSSDDLSSAVLGSVRQATADLTSAVLGADAGSVVAEGLDTIVAAQARRSRLEPKMDPALHASAHHGALPSPQVLEHASNLRWTLPRMQVLTTAPSPLVAAHTQATLSSITCTGVGWLLQASSDDL